MVESESLLRKMLESPTGFDIADDIPSFLGTIRDHYGLSHVAYIASEIPGLADKQPYFRCTYSDEWVNHYIEKEYVQIDPVLHQGRNTILPFDWRCFDRRRRDLRVFFGEAKLAGLGTHGLTIPVRGRYGELALISINSDMSDRDWKKDKIHYMRDFQMMSGFLHQSILRFENVEQEVERLTPREKECLTWLARGKSIDDISVILGISRHTVRVYSDTARAKVNGLNITHAVAKAITLNLIDGPD